MVDSFADRSVADDMYKLYCKEKLNYVIEEAVQKERERLGVNSAKASLIDVSASEDNI